MPLGASLLPRARRESIRPFEDPEWQAWTLAGCILAPLRTLRMIESRVPWTLAPVYGVSEKMMESHLRRVQRHL
jgi:hypothetical protein